MVRPKWNERRRTGPFLHPAAAKEPMPLTFAGCQERKEVKTMNTLVIVLIAAVCLFGAYMLYGRWLANKWGIDPAAKTPAVVQPMLLPSFLTEAYRAPKSVTAPKKMPPSSTHSSTGSQPKAAAWIAPVTGPAPAMELNW